MQHLQDWIGRNQVGDEMVWKGAAHQEYKDFFEFAQALGGDPLVVSTHRSKSIDLPVIEVTAPSGVRVIMRDNFHDINASVWCPQPCDHDLFGLPASDEGYLFFQGFKSEWEFPPFVLGCSKFSLVLGSRALIPFALALRWLFNDDGTLRDPDKRHPWTYPDNPYFEREAMARMVATNSFFPVIYRREAVSVTYRFFKPDDEVIEPDEERLRMAFTRQAPGYDGKVKDEPIPYLTLNFMSGCPEPVDAWLQVVNKLAKERREDPTVKRLGNHVGARVNVTRMTPELRARAEELGCLELLRPVDRS